MSRFKRTPQKKQIPRADALLQVTDGWHGAKLAEKLTGEDRNELLLFIEEHEHLDYIEFEYAVNRWHLDSPLKPKNIYAMHELALAANTRAHG